jgi:hypothetical protein
MFTQQHLSVRLSVCPDSKVIATVTPFFQRSSMSGSARGPWAGANDATEALYKTVAAFSKKKSHLYLHDLVV